jgi:hypothetical protein
VSFFQISLFVSPPLQAGEEPSFSNLKKEEGERIIKSKGYLSPLLFILLPFEGGKSSKRNI